MASCLILDPSSTKATGIRFRYMFKKGFEEAMFFGERNNDLNEDTL